MAALPANDEGLLLLRGDYARTLDKLGRRDEGSAEMDALLPLYKARFGAESNRTLAAMDTLAELAFAHNDYEHSAALARQVAEVRERRLGAEHPDTLANGWEHIYINEAGFDDEGTSIQSIFGEQVLAIDAKDGVLLLRISGKGYRGVLAVGKDPSRLSIEMATTLGTAGQLSGTIAEAHNGVLAMNANGFLDPNGAGNGGLLAGYTMSNGTAYGDHFSAYAYKRIELHEDNLFYIKDALSPVSEDCTDAAEFTPALIVDGKKIMDDYWTGEQPRACIGQSENYEILMLVIEGRYPLEGILGTSVNNCSEILLQHKCMQAINLDGGSSAMLWFDGEYVTQSSSSPLRYTGGRPLPNAWVYKKAES